MSDWILTSVILGGRVGFGCLGDAVAAQHAAISPNGVENHGIHTSADLARAFRELIILKPVSGFVHKEVGQILSRVRKWAIRWIERRGGRVERFALPLATSGHDGISWVDGVRIILPTDEIKKSIAKLRRVARIFSRVRGER